MDLLILFGSAFLAATIFPAQSEAVLLLMQANGVSSDTVLLAVASLGNTLGACVNWGLGRFASGLRDRPWFPASSSQLQRAERWYARWGVWSLLLSWVPFVGDPLTVIAGLLRTPFLTFAIIVAIAKTGRYAVLLWLGAGI
ncbi:MAG: YqaA family protein [Pseudomonadota bacterium]